MINKSIDEQVKKLIEIVLKNHNVKEILYSEPFPKKIPWYLGAGCINQSVRNYLSGQNITDNIDDYDLIYYDATDLSKKSKDKIEEVLRKKYRHLGIELDVTNEARVHLWFEEKFGKKIEQLQSCEDAINTWPTTASAIGINKIDEQINVYAPYGLNDLFSMIVKPNKPDVIKHIYEQKIKKWSKKWPNLKVLSWEFDLITT